ncbi:alpha-L-rhamnosidase [Pseudarcicella hirudinis]|uniref:Alpha-L-rhamnosidase n=2 Tax=Pseudarcicella hirudinis TaxID=1079859 RepID=A0A1I5MFR2_9BACT|nr:alpha-L-rhamnosidase C-terminal domain-containing protein [Pseudarcicella hirudinis]SFP08370.1 alpha-L-rhamnosidase [Pseudarcicella hirudinis]
MLLKNIRIFCLLPALILFFKAEAQNNTLIAPDILTYKWKAEWIAPPGVSLKDFGVFHFRKTFELSQKPKSFVVHVSGDNRYRLFVNGHYALAGPARGDLMHWNFETIDIAPFLHAGTNVIASVVWNFGEDKPWAQISNKTAFILQGNSENEAILNTNKSWKVTENKAYKSIPIDGAKMQAFMVTGCGEDVSASAYIFGWEKPEFSDISWQNAKGLEPGFPYGAGTGAGWYLVPRQIPQMEEKEQEIQEIRRVSGLTSPIHTDWLKGKGILTIPAKSKVTILLDQSFETTAYPELSVSGGKNASVKLTYAEALIDAKRQKGNRNVIEGKEISGNYDIFRPDGTALRTFRPLWFRTYRYIELNIETQNDPLIINSFKGIFTAYPFEEKASFSSNDQNLKNIWNVGWRTARLCGGETYFDCPYYEQLQYTGDTRIQSLISLYVSGDDRLMRKALTDFDNSMLSEGLTQSRYPSNIVQVIPPFSLFWVSMNYDYWMHRKDDAFLKHFLPNIEKVLAWYEQRIDPHKNMLGPMRWWNFADWNTTWPWDSKKDNGGVPEGASDGNSSILTFQFAYTLKQASALFEYFGNKERAIYYRTLADVLAKSTYELCLDENRKVVANTPEKKTFSQHASIFAVLSGAVPRTEERALMEKVLNDQSLSQATFYFRFYLTQALKKANMSDKYYESLTPWREMLKLGLSTFAENPEPVRSDCHAWSSSPNYDFLATICGIMPEQPGFEEVRIQPAFGELDKIEGKMPHPNGQISVKLSRKGNGVNGEIILPDNVSGKFVWKGKIQPLKAGFQTISIE